ncbi:MAG: hypothetical protein HRU12_09220 [Phaeodactylibacter sp.]|nr:hypothetical protein [Phaeodactylibacter sp.]
MFQLLYEEEDVTLPQTPYEATTIKLLQNQGIATAIDWLQQKKEEDEQRTAIAVNALIELGFHQIRGEQAASSVNLFLIADALYPDNPGILSCLAYAYLKSGDLENAKTITDKTLELSPGNDDAKEILDELEYFGF